MKRFPHLTAKMIEVSSALLKERLQPTCEMVENLVKIEQSYINTNHPDFMSAGPAFQAVIRVVEERRRKDLMLRMSQSSSSSVEDVPTLPIETGNGKDGGLFSYLFKSAPPHLNQQQQQPQQQQQQPASPSKTSTPVTRKRTSPTDTAMSEKEEFETQLIMTLLHGYFAIVKRNVMDTVPKACMHFLVNTMVEQLPSRLVAELYKEEMFAELLKEDDNIVKQRLRCRTDLAALQSALQILSELRES